MKQNLVALFSGLLFGLGLAVSQMINPEKVLAFLDVAGHWDPSLAFVMGGALAVMAVAWRLQGKGACAELVAGESRKDLSEITPQLVIGAVLFGLGWGLVGYCPGPAISALPLLQPEAGLFVAAMLAGMLLYRWLPASVRGS